jgi:hypothetical protein
MAKKSKCGFFSSKFIQLTMADKRVINCTKLPLNISGHNDWSITMIGPGNLLLVVPDVYAVPVSDLLVRLPPKTKTAKLRHLGFPIQSTVGDALMKITLGKASSSWAGLALTPPT